MQEKMLQPIVQKYTITLLSGLHIGAGGDGLKIGGIDESVVKHPHTGAPYIPGSSVKGKMRALIEMIDYASEIDKTRSIVKHPSVAKIFGKADKDGNVSSRVLVSDFTMTSERTQRYHELKSSFFEDKAEVTVPRFNRDNTKPRHKERVPAGVKFEGTITLLPVSGGEYPVTADELKETIQKGFGYISQTALGGSGSRGYGRVAIDLVSE